MSKKKKAKGKTAEEINVCLLGKDNEKNRELILNFSSSDDEITEKVEIIIIQKTIRGFSYKINFFFTDINEDKLTETVTKSICIFVLFDMNDRESFEMILENWLIWLRDKYKFERRIVLLGDYIKPEDSKCEFFLAVDDSEVHQMIKVSDIDQIEFLRIGDMGMNKKNATLEDIIVASIPEKDILQDDNNTKSLNGCLII